MRIFLARIALGEMIALPHSRHKAFSARRAYSEGTDLSSRRSHSAGTALSSRRSHPAGTALSSRRSHPAGNALSFQCDDASTNPEQSLSVTTMNRINTLNWKYSTKVSIALSDFRAQFQYRVKNLIIDERGDVPGWVLVVLMTTGLVTGIWTVAAPRIESLLRGSLDSMNNVR